MDDLYIVICRDDSEGDQPGPYMLATRRVFENRADAERYGSTIACGREMIVVAGRWPLLRLPPVKKPLAGFLAALAAILFASLAHAESTMAPMDDHGGLVGGRMPFADSATVDEKLEWLRRQGTAYCPDSSYHLEHRSTGLLCVRPAGR
jgi:hypothetical protein